MQSYTEPRAIRTGRTPLPEGQVSGKQGTMKHPAFFGYGSLVNRATHGYAPASPARLIGWRRVWRHTAQRPVAFLSVEPAEGSAIDGLVAAVPGDDWAALDTREAAYARRRLAPATLAHEAIWASDVQIYTVAGAHTAPSDPHPILLSYVDCVVQGFLHEFGPSGASAFFTSTEGWNAPIRDDRAAPLYPRAQNLTETETAFVDRELAQLGCRPKARP